MAIDLRPAADFELDAFLEPFESAAVRGERPDLSDYLPAKSHPKFSVVLRELVRIDLEFAWERGESRRLDDYLDRFPTLRDDPAALAAIAAEDFRQRTAAGQEPNPDDYRRFNVELSDPSTFDLSLAGPIWAGTAFPVLGDVVPPGFRIESELGRGAFGRVYRAEQADLAGRFVAIKISSRLIGEAQTLARLQHTHIVPVYAIHRVGPYQVLVMPYLGAATFADLVATVRAGGSAPATGRAERTSIASPNVDESKSVVKAPSQHVPTVTLASVLNYGVALADGLAHAHGRGILHRDLKPANILLADDGRPMLLDFNLAADERSNVQGVGGTPRYMAPDQRAALSDPEVKIDGRADVYSLGLILHELLTGDLPTGEVGRIDSPAVAAILNKCLASDPKDRYRSAADLRDDLERHRANRPLAHASEPFGRERFHKWAKRHPRLSSGSSVAISAAMLLAIVGWFGYSAWHSARTAESREARVAVRKARDDVRPMLVDPNTTERIARRAQSIALDALKPYQLPDSSSWRPSRAGRYVPPDEADDLQHDLTEVLFYAAEATGRLAELLADHGALLDEAIALNGRAAELTVDNRTTRPIHEQRNWLRKLDGQFVETRTDASTELDPFLQALGALRARKYGDAVKLLGPLVGRERESYSAWMALGVARLRLSEFDAAADAFLAASVLRTDDPRPEFYRGVALLGAERYASAVEVLGQYSAREPTDPDGWLNRAIAEFRRGESLAALVDLGEAERQNASPARVHGLRAQILQARGEKTKADAETKKLLESQPDDAIGWTIRAEAKYASDAAGSLADFDRALAIDPDHLPAIRGRISVLSERLNRPVDALAILKQLVSRSGSTVSDRAGYAVLLARTGAKVEARTEARKCLGPATAPLPLYQAASALAIVAESEVDRAEVISILRRVLRGDVKWAKEMPGDPDLKSVHTDPHFRELVSAGRSLEGK